MAAGGEDQTRGQGQQGQAGGGGGGGERNVKGHLGNNSFWPFLMEHCRGSFRQQVMEPIVTAFTIYRCAGTGTVYLLTYH